jgi:transcriptional antiterminator RfaH
MKSWYALKTKPQRELVVYDQLQLRSIETYLPLWHTVPLNSAKQKVEPFFPTYLFANIDFSETSLSSVVYMPGMNQVVSREGEPVRVDPYVINSIATQILALEKIAVDVNGKPLVHGDRVQIIRGAFEGYEAIFDRYLDSTDRVRLLIDFLQKQSPLQLERNWVRKQTLDSAASRPRVS